MFWNLFQEIYEVIIRFLSYLSLLFLQCCKWLRMNGLHWWCRSSASSFCYVLQSISARIGSLQIRPRALLHLLLYTVSSRQQKQTASTFIHICIICCCICPIPIGAIIQRNWITWCLGLRQFRQNVSEKYRMALYAIHFYVSRYSFVNRLRKTRSCYI